MSKIQINSVGKTAVMLAVVIGLTACSSATLVRSPGAGGGSSSSRPAVAPRPSVPRPGATVTVQRGDTLYAISRRTNITAPDLAAWNGLASPNTIYPGQTLKLYPPGASKPGASVPIAGTVVSSRPAAPIVAPVGSGFPWRWPAEGVVVGTFVTGETTKQGVDIAGASGQAVRAAADGVVVYSGAGLVGYGELIIIKHNDQWLSAYGHNRKRLLNEGQSVKAGQQIAEMGRSGAARDMLHFEIRYNGKPVDPLLYLPKK
ncbi:peptidoglycan DD-metalloendopeptidase family protein [Xanthomonas fragariae]|uniref:peptidoglycan DD-metalloendopeptidase family protein n=1 Tax=Xanthomonas fragariae TaxID=48664 RepID=UPI0022AAE8AC|nr:peptidoglycan DD-metalloendopeptidase family protein [Xanthomonas fragariae]WAT16264.1 peptidoglycan DD-metalloendopeptidase family protein [Xanthomonas fragariae]